MSAEEKEIGKKFLIEGVLCFWIRFKRKISKIKRGFERIFD